MAFIKRFNFIINHLYNVYIYIQIGPIYLIADSVAFRCAFRRQPRAVMTSGPFLKRLQSGELPEHVVIASIKKGV
jgi:hypothetical protein